MIQNAEKQQTIIDKVLLGRKFSADIYSSADNFGKFLCALNILFPEKGSHKRLLFTVIGFIVANPKVITQK